MRSRKRIRRTQGGFASGPSHAQGGIPGIIKPTGEPIEFEGGEYIIRKSSVDKYGAGAMARINKGLANVSAVQSLKKGGLIKSRKYSKGGKTRRRLAEGGGMNSRRNASCPDGWEHLMPNGAWMCGRTHGMSNYKRGGKAMRKRMKRGGRARRTFQNGGPTCPSGQVWSAGAQQCVNIVDINNPGKGIETFGEAGSPRPKGEVNLFNRGGRIKRRRAIRGRARRTFQNGGPTCPSGQVWSAGAQQCVNIVDINNPGKGIETFGELIDIQNPGRGLQTYRRGGSMQQRNKSRVRAGSHPYTPNLSYLRKGGKV